MDHWGFLRRWFQGSHVSFRASKNTLLDSLPIRRVCRPFTSPFLSFSGSKFFFVLCGVMTGNYGQGQLNETAVLFPAALLQSVFNPLIVDRERKGGRPAKDRDYIGGDVLCGFVLCTTGATTEQISINFPETLSHLCALGVLLTLVGMAIFTTAKNLDAELSHQSGGVCNSF